tara:strand:- start:150 stop:572 length:423 start_codon:yes stop_codon:yes gene_type:complete
MDLLKKITTSLIIGTTLVACADPNKEMKFDANIRRTSYENIILKTTITNYSESDKTLNDIDINKLLHETLNLSRSDGSIGELIPFDNTYSYQINQRIPSGKSLSIYFYGKPITGFISGEVDFIVNNDNWNYRSISVDCCE